MDHRNILRAWYESPKNGAPSSSLTLTEEAFQEAKKKFASDLSRDGRKIDFVNSVAAMEDVQNEVSKSVAKYECQRNESKARKWLYRLSSRIQFYSTVLDVFAQHHPEYVALAWGSIKFLIVAVMNHEKVIATLAKAMSQIADMLPHVELESMLYPTKQMRVAVSELYTSILRFLMRARDWYEEGRISHFIHSITRPVELRYQDIIEQISCNSRTIKELAHSGQLAEFRDMHDSIRVTTDIVNKIHNTVTLHSAALLDTNQRLSDLQFSQIMASLSDSGICDPMKAFQYHQSMRQRRSHIAAVKSIPDSFWKSPKLRALSSTNESSLSIISGTFRSRFAMRNLCVDIIEQLNSAQVPFLLALRIPESGASTNISVNDLLKYLVRQTIRLKQKLQTEKSMSLRCATFHEASTEVEWFQVLEATIANIGGPVYIVVDLEIVDKNFGPSNSFSWIRAFEHLFEALLQRGLSTKLKVLLVTYGSFSLQLSTDEYKKFVVPAKTRPLTVRQRKFGRSSRLFELPLRLQTTTVNQNRGNSHKTQKRRS